jgi:hypothetical protein
MENLRERLPLGSGATLHVHFSPSASEAEIRALLQQSSGRIVNGPGADAGYSVRVPGKKAQTALDEFRGSSIVDSVDVRRPGFKR